MKAIVFGMIGVGLLLLVLSAVWTNLFPGTSTWTAQKAERSSQIKARLESLIYVINAPANRARSGPNIDALKAEYEQLKQENEQLNADFVSAHDSPRTASTLLKWSGISLAVVGVVGWYAVKNAS